MAQHSVRTLVVPIFSYGLVAVFAAAAIAAWAQPYRWELSTMTTYDASALFDILAFSMLTVLVILGAVATFQRVAYGAVRLTTLLLLLSLALHPGFLFWQLWRDGYGLPPLSYLHFYSQDQLIPITIGTAGFGAMSVCALLLSRRWIHSRWLLGVVIAAAGAMYYYTLMQSGFVHRTWVAGWWIGCGVVAALSAIIWMVRAPRLR